MAIATEIIRNSRHKPLSTRIVFALFILGFAPPLSKSTVTVLLEVSTMAASVDMEADSTITAIIPYSKSPTTSLGPKTISNTAGTTRSPSPIGLTPSIYTLPNVPIRYEPPAIIRANSVEMTVAFFMDFSSLIA